MEARADNARSLEIRRLVRGSYGCDCNGDHEGGRVEPAITDGVLRVVRDWTGVMPDGCPWHAFYDPFVRRVLDGFEWFDKGQLETLESVPSNRLLEGITHYHRALGAVRARKLDQERERAKRESESKR